MTDRGVVANINYSSLEEKVLVVGTIGHTCDNSSLVRELLYSVEPSMMLLGLNIRPKAYSLDLVIEDELSEDPKPSALIVNLIKRI